MYQSLEELLSESDFVSIHCPLNDSTRGMLDYEKLSLMKPTSYLINTARGAICNEDDLIRILREKENWRRVFGRANERTSRRRFLVMESPKHLRGQSHVDAAHRLEESGNETKVNR